MNEYLSEGEQLNELSPKDRQTFFELCLISETGIDNRVLWADEIKAQNQGLRIQARFIDQLHQWVTGAYGFTSNNLLYRIHPDDVHMYIKD